MLQGTQRVNSRGHLEVGGVDALELAREFGTPLYVVDEAALRANLRNYKAAFEARYPKNEIYYASKAALTLAHARLVAQEGCNMDVASLGELHVALQAGFPPARLALHGNNKSREELEAAAKRENRPIKPHRDGTSSFYTKGVSGNAVELIYYPEDYGK